MRYNLPVEELCRKLKPVFGKKIDLLYLKYRMSDSREKKAEIEQALNALYTKHLNESMLSETILLEPPKEEIISGDYPLGTVSYADKDLYTFGMKEKEWPRHVCVSGMSGSGKTTFAYQILGGFLIKKKPFLIFDWKKSFRPLMLIDDKVLCFTVGNSAVSNHLKININEPPENVDPKEWLNVLTDLITESFFASYGVHKIISETLDKAFKDFGVYKGSKNYPTWLQIKDRLEQKAEKLSRSKGRESEWITSALRIAHALTFGSFGEAITYKGKTGWRIDQLFDKKVILELNSLNNIEKKFFCEFILTYIYKHKKANESGTGKFKHAIIVDEAHNIFLKDRPHFIKESITDMIYREIREYGTSLICLDQHISKLSDVVAGNSACNIAFQQVLPSDVDAVAGIMQLRDYKNYFSMLPVGHAIVRLAERHFKPFLIKAPDVPITKEEVTNDFVAKRMKSVVEKMKKISLFEDSCKDDRLTKKISRMADMLKSTGVSPEKNFEQNYVDELVTPIDAGSAMKQESPEDLIEHLNKTQEEYEKEKNAKPLHISNHKQLFLMEEIKKLVLKGFTLANARSAMEIEGYNITDIKSALARLKRDDKEFNIQAEINQKIIEVNTRYEKKLDKLNTRPLLNPESKPYTQVYEQVLKDEQADTAENDLTGPEKEFLKAIALNPGKGTTEIYKLLNLSARKGNSLKLSLLEKGLIYIEEAKSEKGRKKVLKIKK